MIFLSPYVGKKSVFCVIWWEGVRSVWWWREMSLGTPGEANYICSGPGNQAMRVGSPAPRLYRQASDDHSAICLSMVELPPKFHPSLTENEIKKKKK